MKLVLTNLLIVAYLVTGIGAVVDFEKAPAGKMRDYAGWHASSSIPGVQVVDTGNKFYNKALKLPHAVKGAMSCLYKFAPADSGTLEIDFDFWANSYKIEPRIAVALKNSSLKLLPYKSAVWLGLGYKNKLYYFSRGWNSLDVYDLNKWHHLKIIVHISGERAGTFDVNLNGGDFEGIGLKWRNELDVSPQNPLGLFYVGINRNSKIKNDEYLLIDNFRIARIAAKEQKQPVKAAFNRVVKDSFASRVLGKNKNYTVILPENYDKSKKYPVLYLFHGRGRNENSLSDDRKARTALMRAKFITILPDGDDNWYINSPVDPKSRYNDYIEELMRLVEKKYPVSADRKHRGLSGWSMGGYGCTMFAEAHPDKFSALAPVIALLDYPRVGLPKKQSYPVQTKCFGPDQAVWKKFNPINNITKLKNMKLLIITGRQCFTLTMNRNFVARLKQEHIPVQYDEVDGGHSFSVVIAALPRIVEFMNQTLTI